LALLIESIGPTDSRAQTFRPYFEEFSAAATEATPTRCPQLHDLLIGLSLIMNRLCDHLKPKMKKTL
jgi:hypothetical protein